MIDMVKQKLAQMVIENKNTVAIAVRIAVLSTYTGLSQDECWQRIESLAKTGECDEQINR